jgi:hypothetical protein
MLSLDAQFLLDVVKKHSYRKYINFRFQIFECLYSVLLRLYVAPALLKLPLFHCLCLVDFYSRLHSIVYRQLEPVFLLEYCIITLRICCLLFMPPKGGIIWSHRLSGLLICHTLRDFGITGHKCLPHQDDVLRFRITSLSQRTRSH